MIYQKTVAQVSELIEAMKSQYDGKLGHYQHWTVKRWQEKHGSSPVPGFQVTGWFPCGGHILLEWPVVDLDMAISHLLYWRSREGCESIAGAGLMHSTTLGFGGFGLAVDSDGKIVCQEYEMAIRNSLSNEIFPEWSIGFGGEVSITPMVYSQEELKNMMMAAYGVDGVERGLAALNALKMQSVGIVNITKNNIEGYKEISHSQKNMSEYDLECKTIVAFLLKRRDAFPSIPEMKESDLFKLLLNIY